MEKHTVEFFLVIDADGNVELGTDREETIGNCTDNYGANTQRVIKFTAKVTLPEAEEEIDTLDVPDTAGETVTATAE